MHTKAKTAVERLLRESEGALGDEPIAEIVNQQLGTRLSRYAVTQIRDARGFPKAKRGFQSADVVALLAKHGIARVSAAEVATRRTEPRSAGADGAPGPGFADALRAALRNVAETVCAPYGVAAMTVTWAEGKWQVQGVKRVVTQTVSEDIAL